MDHFATDLELADYARYTSVCSNRSRISRHDSLGRWARGRPEGARFAAEMLEGLLDT